MKPHLRPALIYFCIAVSFCIGERASGYTNLTSAYAALGFDPNYPGNKVVVFCSDQHMNLDIVQSGVPEATTNFQWQLVRLLNGMSPRPAKIIWTGDNSCVLSQVPGMDESPYAYEMATNEMNFFKVGLSVFTNIDQTNIVWIPGNHDQTPNETNAEIFRYVFPFMPTRQTFDIGGVRFILFNSGNYGAPSASDVEWLRALIAATPSTQQVAFATHQQPYPGAATQRKVGALLNDLFGSWQSRWWIMCGHGHGYGILTYDVGPQNVAQLMCGPSSTNTFVGYNQDVGCMFLCLSNGMAGQIYYRMKYESFELGYTDWAHPAHYVAPFSETPGILWQRFKSHTNFAELVFAYSFNDSWDWFAYPQDLQWALPLAQHNHQATEFMLLAEPLEPTVQTFFSPDGTNWTQTPVPPPTNHVYKFPIPLAIRSQDTGYFRLKASDGNNYTAGWGLSTTNPPPYVRYPKITHTNLQAIAGRVLTVSNLITDPYFPPDPLTFTLTSAPSGVQIDQTTGIFMWTPPLSYQPYSVSFQLGVRDAAPVPFGDTQTVTIAVSPPPPLFFDNLTWTGQQLSVSVFGDTGLVYLVQVSTNLVNWTTVQITNSPLLPLHLQLPVNRSITKTFYRAITTSDSPPPDMDAFAFLARAGITNPVQTNAILQLVADSKAHGWWTNCDAIYPFVGGTATAHSCNLKSGQYNMVWHGNVLHDGTGITGDASTGYGDTGYNFKQNGATFSTNSSHLFVYGGTATVNEDGSFIGGFRWYGGTLSRSFIKRSFGALSMSGLNNNDGGSGSAPVNSDFRGPLIASRTGVTTQFLGARGIAWGAGSTTPTIQPPDVNCAVLARIDQSFVPEEYSNCNLRGASIGGGMSQPQWDVFRADWDRFEAALGRKVP